MTLLKVLIVDDELPLRQELRSMPWESFGAVLVGEAENGEEALALCEALHPELVITDITMPIMDGMELFRRVRAAHPTSQFVLLTCHSDFAYAQEALKLGALAYVTKLSFEESDMKAAVDKAKEAILRERDHQRTERERKRWEQTKLLNTLEKREQYALEAAAALWSFWQPAAPFIPVRVHLAAKEGERSLLLHELQEALEQLPAKQGEPAEWAVLGDQELLLIRGQEEAACETEQLLQLLHEQLERQLPFMSGAYRLLAVHGAPVRQPEELIASLRATTLPEAMLFYNSSLTALTAAQAGANPLAPKEHPQAASLRQLWLQQQEGKEALYRFYQDQLGPWMLAQRFEPAALKAFLLQQREELAQAQPELRHEQFEAVTQQLRNAPTAAELLSVLTGELKYNANEHRKVRREVQLAKKLIAANLAEPITLTSISEEVGLSSYYFSRLFREEVGETFNDYVTRLRMEKAVQLLQSTQLKVYEVAERVGIPSYRYFSQLFRQWTGVAPTDYKKG
jgi:two-component system, response regulator YesN